jgi:hypothetical protein
MTTTRPGAANAWAANPDREAVTMTSHTPAPGPDAPDGTTKPSQAPAAELLNGAALPATTATAVGPKIPPFVGD